MGSPSESLPVRGGMIGYLSIWVRGISLVRFQTSVLKPLFLFSLSLLIVRLLREIPPTCASAAYFIFPSLQSHSYGTIRFSCFLPGAPHPHFSQTLGAQRPLAPSLCCVKCAEIWIPNSLPCGPSHPRILNGTSINAPQGLNVPKENVCTQGKR